MPLYPSMRGSGPTSRCFRHGVPRGGARDGRPRCERMRWLVAGCSITANRRMGPAHRGHTRPDWPHVRFISTDHVRRHWRSGSSGPTSGSPSGGPVRRGGRVLSDDRGPASLPAHRQALRCRLGQRNPEPGARRRAGSQSSGRAGDHRWAASVARSTRCELAEVSAARRRSVFHVAAVDPCAPPPRPATSTPSGPAPLAAAPPRRPAVPILAALRRAIASTSRIHAGPTARGWRRTRWDTRRAGCAARACPQRCTGSGACVASARNAATIRGQRSQQQDAPRLR